MLSRHDEEREEIFVMIGEVEQLKNSSLTKNEFLSKSRRYEERLSYMQHLLRFFDSFKGK